MERSDLEGLTKLESRPVVIWAGGERRKSSEDQSCPCYLY